MKEDLQHLRDYVQSVVETQTDPTQAAAIITSAAMYVRKVSNRVKLPLSAKTGKVPGTAVVTAKAVARPVTFFWQYSSDGGATWTDMPQTLKASTTLTGLTALKAYAFRFRTLTRVGLGEWSPPASVTLMQ